MAGKKPDSMDDIRDEDADLEALAEDVVGQDSDGDLAGELAAEKDRALRLHAEMQNVRNRLSREIADVRKYAEIPIVSELLPILDNVDRAIEASEKTNESAALLEGFRLVRQQIATLLSQHGVERIESVGEPFDPAFHQAILQQPSDEFPAGTVMMETQSGYQLHDRVVRPAHVIVSSGPA